MEAITRTLQIVAVIAIIGALVETFFPGSISEATKNKLSALTIGILGLLLSFLFLMFFLKLRIREGFEDNQVQEKWKTIMESNKIQDVCKLYNEMYEKILAVEKGTPDEKKTEAQAREATDKRFQNAMSLSPVNCKEVEELNSKVTSVDGFFLLIQKAPDSLLSQVYDTATGCRRLLIENYLKLKEAEDRKVEGFQDICSEEQAQEKRDFIKRNTLSVEAQKCLLVEDIPQERKVFFINQKLSKMEKTFEDYKKEKNIKDSITKVLDDCAYYKAELEKKAKEAEEMSNRYNFT